MAKARKGIINPPGHPITVTSGPSHVAPAKVATTGQGLKYRNVGVQASTKRGNRMGSGVVRANPARITGR